MKYLSRNPYFIGINSAIHNINCNNTFIKVAILILLELTLQWCYDLDAFLVAGVAILILLELTLQYNKKVIKNELQICRNPYFIGINSAIEYNPDLYFKEI